MIKNKTIARIAALLCCMCLLLADLPARMFAAENDMGGIDSSGEVVTQPVELQTVNVEVTIPLHGQTDTRVTYTDDYEGYTVEASTVYWEDAGGYPASSFSKGNTYRVIFQISPKKGYILTPNTTVTVNGSADSVTLVGDSESPASIIEFKCEPEVLGDIVEIRLPELPTAALGEAPDNSFTHTDEENHYSASGYWCRYNADTKQYETMANTDTFANGEVYGFLVDIKPEVGYSFEDSLPLYIDGLFVEHMNNNEVDAEYQKIESFATEITEISIATDAIPKAVVGETFTDTPLEIPVAEGSNYTLSGRWVCEDDDLFEGTFENGKSYRLDITITPNAGYILAEMVEILFGEDGGMGGANTNGTSAQCSLVTSFKESIARVELLQLPEAVLGEKLQTDYFPVSVPEGANYHAEALWYVYDEELRYYTEITAENDTVTQGKKYQLYVLMHPASGFEFAENLLVNANNVDVQGNSRINRADVYYDYFFCEEIDKVEITGITAPVAGATPSQSIQIPADANYEIAHVEWYDNDTYEIDTVFEQGHSYYLEMVLSPKSEYAFAEDVQGYVDGERVSVGLHNEMDIRITVDYSLKDVIQEVQISDLPKMQIGEQAVSKDVNVSEQFYGTIYWEIWNDTKQMYEPFEGTFASGNIYRLCMDVFSEDGYRFSEDETRFFIEGKVSDNVLVFYEGHAAYYENFSTEEAVEIDEIQITVSAPVPGAHASILPNIQITGEWKDKITVCDEIWLRGSYEECIDLSSEYFKADKAYGFGSWLIAKEGYVFSDQVNIVVNGVSLPVQAVNNNLKECHITYFFDYKTQTIYETFGDADITEELKAAGFTTEETISAFLQEELKKADAKLAGAQLYNVSLQYWNGQRWSEAAQDDFPNNGKVTVDIPVPNGTSSKTHNYTVAHLFAANAFGKTVGTYELPTFTVKTGTDGKEYLVVELVGCSPVMIGWSLLETSTGGPGNAGGEGESDKQPPNQEGDDKLPPNQGNDEEGGDDKLPPNQGNDEEGGDDKLPPNQGNDEEGGDDKLPPNQDNGEQADPNQNFESNEDKKSPTTDEGTAVYTLILSLFLISGCMMTVLLWRKRKI